MIYIILEVVRPSQVIGQHQWQLHRELNLSEERTVNEESNAPILRAPEDAVLGWPDMRNGQMATEAPVGVKVMHPVCCVSNEAIVQEFEPPVEWEGDEILGDHDVAHDPEALGAAFAGMFLLLVVGICGWTLFQAVKP